MKNQTLTLSLFKLTAVAGLTLFAAVEAYAASVSTGAIEGADLKAAVRYRHMNGMGFGQRRVYLGTLPLETNNGPTNISWGTGKHIKFSYDASTQQLTTVVGSGSSAVTVSKSVGDLGELNYILLNVQRNGHPPMPSMINEISLINVLLNGSPLNDSPLNGVFQGAPSGAKWSIKGEDLSDRFVMEGDIVLTGMQPGSDNNHIQINVGYADQTGPKVDAIGINPNPAIVNGYTTLRATVSDADTGNNTITSAEYRLNGGNWELMAAQDGGFDGISEYVIAELPATKLGSNEVCLRGVDSKGNVTEPPVCSTFLVTYQFDGFNEHIANDLINTAQAGQAVPVKWRISDANGLPIENSASFAGLYSYPIDCGIAEHSPHDAVEEYAPGNSGLHYKTDGQWQYNWKTPKTYSGTCRAMYVEFDSGALSPIVTFQFK
jgi:hypothetical protein